MSYVLVRSSTRYIGRHPWLFALSVLGVAMGVAVVVAIDVANSSARRAFELSAEAVAGQASHQIQRPNGPLPDSVYRMLRVDLGVHDAAPIVEGFVRADDRILRVLGIDPLSEDPFRGYTSGRSFDLGRFMSEPTTLMSTHQASLLRIAEGDWLPVQVGGVPDSLFVLALIEPADEHMRLSLGDLLIVDVSTAQRMFGLQGQLTGIDLLIPAGEEADVLARIDSILPAGAKVERSGVRTRTLEQMTRAFEINLSALSLLALVVGMFLIYNTMTFSVVQRRGMIGRLRAIGVTGREISLSVLAEALVVALLGTMAGFALGILLADRLVGLVAQTINDLYFVVNVTSLAVEPWTIAKAISLGLGATLLTAYFPAHKATGVPAGITLQRSIEEDTSRRRAPRLTVAGVIILATGGAVLLVSGQSILLSYVGFMALIIGFVLMVPLLTIGFTHVIRPAAGAVFGLTGRMAARGLATSLSRLSVAIAALTVAIAATIGVGVMIDSFRDTVDVWLGHTLRADVYIQPPTLISRGGQGEILSEAIERIRAVEGVDELQTVRSRQIVHEGRPANLLAVDADPAGSITYRLKEGDDDVAWARFSSGEAALISEPFAYRFDLSTADALELSTDSGIAQIPIAGIYYDYGSDLGEVALARPLYERLYEDRARSGVSLILEPGEDVDVVMERIRVAVAGIQDLSIRSNRGLRESSMEVFDRTFRITAVLRILTILVACIGLFSAFMSIQLEKMNEIAVMRAQGFTPGQVRGYITVQSVLGGLLAGLLALPLGLLLAGVLVYVINKRSFGWTLQFLVQPEILFQAVLLAVVAAFAAALYPAWRAMRTPPGIALREE